MNQALEKKQSNFIINPGQLIEKAISKDVDIEKLEKLMDLQERFEKNQARKSYFFAMNEFQSRKPDIVKNQDVAFKEKKQFSFAGLSYIQKLVDPILSLSGLSYTWKQSAGSDAKSIVITCVVSHIDGHSEETLLEGSHDSSGSKNSIQAIGSAVSYLKRYTLMNALGLSTGDDDGAKSQMTPDEVNAMALEKLQTLFKEKIGTLSDSLIERIKEIILKKESSSYKKAIKTLEK